MKVLLIDNYDSFIYNLRYQLESLDAEVTVCRNDIDYERLCNLVDANDAIVISPGPSDPKSVGHCLRLIQDHYNKKPMLGICLGHQSIVEACGGIVDKASQVLHGKCTAIELFDSSLFNGINPKAMVARYHSLIAKKVPTSFKITAVAEQDQVMAIEHQLFPVFGLQFHPESLMTMQGNAIMNNFKTAVIKYKGAKHVAIA